MAEWIIKQGEDSGITFPIYDPETKEPFNFSGWTGVTQIRAHNTNKLLHEFTTAAGNMILTTNGQLTLLWTAEETSTWKWKQAQYGIEVINPEGKRARLKQDIVLLSKEFVV
jgi:hypothetical protein